MANMEIHDGYVQVLCDISQWS